MRLKSYRQGAHRFAPVMMSSIVHPLSGVLLVPVVCLETVSDHCPLANCPTVPRVVMGILGGDWGDAGFTVADEKEMEMWE